MDNKKLWDSMKKMTNTTSAEKGIVTSNDLDKTNAPNDFFLRFDSRSSSPPGLAESLDHLCSSSDCVKIDPIEVQSVFRDMSNKKSMGSDGLPAILLKYCSSELTVAWSLIFQLTNDSHTVPAL